MTPLPSKNKTGFESLSSHDTQFGLPVAADEVYEPFGVWLDGRLEELVSRWIHLAAPNASHRERAIRSARRS
jgi:hypothetical protein